MLGPPPHRSYPRRQCIAQKLSRNEVDDRRAKPAGHISAVGPLIDLARGAELNENPLAHHADPIRHCHRFDLVMRHIEDSGSQLALDELELDAKQLRYLLDPTAYRFLIQAPGRRAQGEGQIVIYRQMRIKRILLKD